MAFFPPHDRDRSVYGIKKPPFSQFYESLITLQKYFTVAEKNRGLVKSRPLHALPHATPDARFAPTTRRAQ